MIRVAMTAGSYRPERCGVAHYTARLREALDQRGVRSVVLTTRAAASAPGTVGVVSGWRPADLLPLLRAVHATQADLLHIQHAAGTYGFERAIFLLPLLLRATKWRAPIVTTVHEYGWWEWQPRGVPAGLLERLKRWGQRRGWWDREDGFLLTLSDALITTNADAETVIRSRLPHLADRLCRIPIGANVEVAPIERAAARRRLRRACGWPDDAAVIAFFGFLHPVKGLETLLPAFKQVVAAQPGARLVLIGGAESLALRGEHAAGYWDKLQALAADLGLTGRVHMTGYLPEAKASRCLAGADVGVLPFNGGVTLKSGSLLALLAHGLPVVATRHDPPDPALADGRLVRLVAPRDVEGLATALTQLLADAAARARLAAAGRAFARAFTWPAIAQRHLDVYRLVLEGRPVTEASESALLKPAA